ncbi:MAG: hypothetical protein ACUVSS_16165, partial [Anaerolineae bacterium]
TWGPPEQLADRRSLTVPDAALPGAYRLLLVLYDPANGQRLPVRLTDGTVSDALPLLTVEVAP